MAFNLKTSLFLVVLLLSACTVAVNDPERFEKQATHAERQYNLSLNDLYACMMRKATVGGSLSTWKSDKEAYHGQAGFYETRMTAIGADKTLVRMSSVKSAYIQAFDQWFSELDKCGGSESP